MLLMALLAISACSVLTPLQRSKMLSVNHLIDNSQYAEAKEIVEDMVQDESLSDWSRTWYARGKLAQNAYREGIRRNNKSMLELYSDPLYVAYESFEKAMALDPGPRLQKQLAPKYVLLANDFQRLGERLFNGGQHEASLRAFEHTLLISSKSFLAIQPDTNLVYNAGLAAFEAGKFQTATLYLEKIHRKKSIPNASHLLFKSHLALEDTIQAQVVLEESVRQYENNADKVLLLADLHVARGDAKKALHLLDGALAADTSNYVYPMTKGLILQRTGQFQDAIHAYTSAFELAPEEYMIYVRIATCYYNIAAEIDAYARTLTNNRLVLEQKELSGEALRQAAHWLDKVYEQEPQDPEVVHELIELYKLLRLTDRARSIEDQL